MNFKLHSHQLMCCNEAERIIRRYGLVYLAMEVRTGKTHTALSLAERSEKIKAVLFVTKKKAIASVMSDYDVGGYTFYFECINYESLHKVRGDFQCVIIDEAHSIGAYPRPSKRTLTLREICKGKAVIYLSGTPSPESYSQLFHQFWVSSFGPWKEYRNFYQWVKSGYVDAYQMRYGNKPPMTKYEKANEAKIKAETAKYFVSLSQKEAGFTELVEEEILTCDMDPDTAKWIKQLDKDRIIEETAWGEPIVADTGAKLMQKIHQISSGTVSRTVLNDDGKERREYRIFDRRKAWFIEQVFRGKKIAIFYKFVGEGMMLKQKFPNWTDSPEVFNSEPDRTFIGQFQAAREGVNLKTAQALIMMNIDYSAVSYWQSRARLLHKDRSTPAKLYWIFSDCGIEREIYDVVVKKQDYNIGYYRNARKQIAKENNQLPRIKGVVDFKDNKHEQKRSAGPVGNEGRVIPLFGNQSGEK